MFGPLFAEAPLAIIPDAVLDEPLPFPLRLLRRGKVRDTYALPDHSDKLLMRASNRISIYDFVLPALVPGKGEVLTALNGYWRKLLGKIPHDLLASGSGIDDFLPKTLRGNANLQARAVVVERIDMLPVEAVVRGYLTGSAWKAYQEGKPVCGQTLPPGLVEGARLREPLFTPTTKAENGHDRPVDADAVMTRHPKMAPRTELLYRRGAALAGERGLLIADTKFEFGGRKGWESFVLADEVLTPDSSRFWDADEWKFAQQKGRLPKSLDKQLVRDWGKSVGIHELDPQYPVDIAWVHDQKIPEDLLRQAAGVYQDLFQRLTGSTLERYQRDVMGIVR
jgi:phosphoribosylaminoimidazole-succinocarboxamide synthase